MTKTANNHSYFVLLGKCCARGESKSTASYVLLSTKSTSNFEYEWCKQNIKISMNAYKYLIRFYSSF